MVKNVALLFACLRSRGTCQRFEVERNHTLEILLYDYIYDLFPRSQRKQLVPSSTEICKIDISIRKVGSAVFSCTRCNFGGKISKHYY